MRSKSQISKEFTMQFMSALINTLACPTEVLVAVVFLLESQQCISYESVNDWAKLSRIFKYLLRNSFFIVKFLREKKLKRSFF